MKRYRDSHHILHNRQEWSLRPDAKSLRGHNSLVIPLQRVDHELLHAHTTAVPLLGYHTLARTVKMYEPKDTPIKSVESLMLSIEQAANHPKAHIIEKHLAELAVWALDLQRPFIAGVEYNG